MKLFALGLPFYKIVSLRSSERGLKFHPEGVIVSGINVAPFVGAWIEIQAVYQ